MKERLRHLFRHPDDRSLPMTGVELTGGMLGGVLTNLLPVVVITFMQYFYTDVVGIDAGLAGTVVLAARLINALTDLISGVIISRTRSRFGQARPWLLRLVLPMALITMISFSVPPFLGVQGKNVYIIVTYTLMNAVLFSLVSMATAVIPPSQSSHARSRQMVGILASLCGVIFNGAVIAGVQWYTTTQGDTPEAWRLIGILLGSVVLLGMGVMFITSHERTETSAVPGTTRPPVPFIEGVKALRYNKYWIIMALVAFLGAVEGGLGSGNIFYFRTVLGDPNIMAANALITLFPNAGCLILIAIFRKRLNQQALLMGGLALKAVTYLVNAVFYTSPTAFLLCSVVRSVASTPFWAFNGVFLVNTIEYGEWKTGLRTDSLNITMSSFGSRLGSGLGGAMVGWLLSAAGYVKNAAVQPEAVAGTTVWISLILPAGLVGIMAILLGFYDLDKHYEGITAALKQRHQPVENAE